jgi:hypothetical protein
MQKPQEDRGVEGAMAPETGCSRGGGGGVGQRLRQLRATPLRVRLCYQQAPPLTSATYQVVHKQGGAIELSGMYEPSSSSLNCLQGDSCRPVRRLPAVRGAAPKEKSDGPRLPVNINLNFLGEDEEDCNSSDNNNDDHEDDFINGLSYKWNFERPDIYHNNCNTPPNLKFARSKTDLNHHVRRSKIRENTTIGAVRKKGLFYSGHSVSDKEDVVKEKPSSSTTQSVHSKESQEPAQGHPSATSSNTQGHLSATPTRTQGNPSATSNNTQGHPSATPTRTQGNPSATSNNTQGHPSATSTSNTRTDQKVI